MTPPEDAVTRAEWIDLRKEMREWFTALQGRIDQVLQRSHHTPSDCPHGKEMDAAWQAIHQHDGRLRTLEQSMAKYAAMAALGGVLLGYLAQALLRTLIR